jgi:hypothetical protein
MAENDNENVVDISTVDRGLPYFNYSASIRIFGEIADLDAISARLGLQPTRVHRHGEGADHSSRGPDYQDDAWCYTAPIQEERPLDEHIQALWNCLEPHKEYLLELKRSLNVEVCCSYRTNHWGAGFQVSPKSLEMFTALQIPFGVSVIII